MAWGTGPEHDHGLSHGNPRGDSPQIWAGSDVGKRLSLTLRIKTREAAASSGLVAIEQAGDDRNVTGLNVPMQGQMIA